MKFNLKTDIFNDKIIQELNYEREDIITKIFREMYDTKDKQFKDALVKLGWTPPIKDINNG